MRLSIAHHTGYQYDAAINHSIQYLRLTPRSSTRQQVLDWQLRTPARPQRLTDGYGNILDVLTIDAPHQALDVEVCGEVEISGQDSLEAEVVAPAVFLRATALTSVGPGLQQFLRSFRRDQPPTLTTLTRLMSQLLLAVPLADGVAGQSAEAAFAAGSGLSPDHAHIFVACCRALGIPARYVSGYVASQQDAGVAAHAWAEAWLDGQWRTFDVSNALTRPSCHLKLAVGLDYLDACPVRGARLGNNGSELLAAYALAGVAAHHASQ